MIRVNELMLNNWVKLNETNYRVKDLYKSTCIHLYENAKGYDIPIDFNSDYLEKYLEPINLTVDILKNNGFKLDTKNDDYELYICDTNNFCIEYYISKNKVSFSIVYNSNDIHGCISKLKEPIYVHEIQNVLANCKIDKDIII